MFSTCSKLTPRAPIPDGRMAQFMQPCLGHGSGQRSRTDPLDSDTNVAHINLNININVNNNTITIHLQYQHHLGHRSSERSRTDPLDSDTNVTNINLNINNNIITNNISMIQVTDPGNDREQTRSNRSRTCRRRKWRAMLSQHHPFALLSSSYCCPLTFDVLVSSSLHCN